MLSSDDPPILIDLARKTPLPDDDEEDDEQGDDSSSSKQVERKDDDDAAKDEGTNTTYKTDEELSLLATNNISNGNNNGNAINGTAASPTVVEIPTSNTNNSTISEQQSLSLDSVSTEFKYLLEFLSDQSKSIAGASYSALELLKDVHYAYTKYTLTNRALDQILTKAYADVDNFYEMLTKEADGVQITDYKVSIPQPQLGLTVENLMECSIIRSLSPNGGAIQNPLIQVNSVIVEINGENIVHYSHFEVVELLRQRRRPMELTLRLLDERDGRQRRAVAMNGLNLPVHPSSTIDKARVSMRTILDYGGYIPNSTSLAKIDDYFVPKLVDLALLVIYGHKMNNQTETFQAGMAALYDYLHAMYAANPSKGGFNNKPSAFGTMQNPENKRISLLNNLALNRMNIVFDKKKLKKQIRKTLRPLLLGEPGIQRPRAIVNDQSSKENLDSHKENLLHQVILFGSSSILNPFDLLAFSMELNEDEACSDIEIPISLLHKLAGAKNPSSRIAAARWIPSIVTVTGLESYLGITVRGIVNRLTHDASVQVKLAALESLAKIIDASMSALLRGWCIVLIEKLVNDTSADVRSALVRLMHLVINSSSTVGDVTSSGGSTNAAASAKNDENALHLLKCKLLPVLTNMSEDNEISVRTSVANALNDILSAFGSHWGHVVMDIWIQLSKDTVGSVRAAAVSALVEGGASSLQDDLIISMLTRLAQDPVGDVRCFVSKAAVKYMRIPPIYDIVVESLNSTDSRVLSTTVSSLLSLGSNKDLSPTDDELTLQQGSKRKEPSLTVDQCVALAKCISNGPAQSADWRIRQQSLHLLPDLLQYMFQLANDDDPNVIDASSGENDEIKASLVAFQTILQHTCKKLMVDSIESIRTSAAEALIRGFSYIFMHNLRHGTEQDGSGVSVAISKGSGSVVNSVLDQLKLCAESKNHRQRILCLKMVQSLLNSLQYSSSVEDEFVCGQYCEESEEDGGESREDTDEVNGGGGGDSCTSENRRTSALSVAKSELLTQLLNITAALSGDKVANVRLNIPRVLEPHLNLFDKTQRSFLIVVLEDLVQADRDLDVRYYCQLCLNKLKHQISNISGENDVKNNTIDGEKSTTEVLINADSNNYTASFIKLAPQPPPLEPKEPDIHEIYAVDDIIEDRVALMNNNNIINVSSDSTREIEFQEDDDDDDDDDGVGLNNLSLDDQGYTIRDE